MVKKTRLAGICLFGEVYDDTSQCCLVLDFLNEPPEWNVLEVLLLFLLHLDFLFPAIVLAHDDATDAVLDTQVHDELAGMVEVVFNLEVSLPARPLVGVLVVQPVDALEDTTVDQYRMTELTGGYRSQIIYANVDTTYVVFADFLFLDFTLVLYVHHKAKSLGRDDHLLVVSDAFDAEAVVTRRDGHEFLVLLGLSSLDGFVVEDDLSQFVFVVRRFGTPKELARVFLVGIECLLEIRPISQTLTDSLLCRLGVVQVTKAVLGFDSSDEGVDVG